MIRSIASVFIAVAPFDWQRPRYEKTVLDTVIYCGPVRIAWENPA